MPVKEKLMHSQDALVVFCSLHDVRDKYFTMPGA
jgi:hypothetical protein